MVWNSDATHSKTPRLYVEIKLDKDVFKTKVKPKVNKDKERWTVFWDEDVN